MLKRWTVRELVSRVGILVLDASKIQRYKCFSRPNLGDLATDWPGLRIPRHMMLLLR